MQVLKVALVLGLFWLMIVCGSVLHDIKSPGGSRPKITVLEISTTAPCVIDRRHFPIVAEVLRNKSELELAILVKRGAVLILPESTLVSVESYQEGVNRIKIHSGEHTGESCYVAKFALRTSFR